MTEIKRGDRLIIKNIPEDYQFKDLYAQGKTGLYEGIIDTSIFQERIKEGAVTTLEVPFLTGYIPFFDGRMFECSGSGHSINRYKIKWVKRDKALFWKWKDGISGASRGEHYEAEVDYWECDFVDIN